MKKLKKIVPAILALSLITACSNTDSAQYSDDAVATDAVSSEDTESTGITEVVDTVEDKDATVTEAEQEVDLFNPEPTVLSAYSEDENLKTFTDTVNQITFDYNDSFLAISDELVESTLKDKNPKLYQEMLSLAELYESLDMTCFYILDEAGEIKKTNRSNFIYTKMDLGVGNIGNEMYSEYMYEMLIKGLEENLPQGNTIDTQTPVLKINDEKYLFSTVYNSEFTTRQLVKQAPNGTVVMFQLTTFEDTEEYDTLQFEKLVNSISIN